jgi:DNA polymerase III delta subunit
MCGVLPLHKSSQSIKKKFQNEQTSFTVRTFESSSLLNVCLAKRFFGGKFLEFIKLAVSTLKHEQASSKDNFLHVSDKRQAILLLFGQTLFTEIMTEVSTHGMITGVPTF